MRNLKKILALVLALVMSMSLVTVASAAYADQDQIDARYAEAVEVLSDMGIFKGYNGGASFGPKALITREEVATMMYRVISTDVTDTNKGMFVEAANFSDVASTKWSAGYIGYCYNGNYVKGYEDGTFGPAKNVTGYEVLAMILRAVGYDKNGEFSGANWKKNIGTVAQQLGILNNVAPTVVLSQPATRELVAELIFRTMATVDMVEYTPAFSYQPILVNTGTATTTLGLKNFGLNDQYPEYVDYYGRPGYTWNYDVYPYETIIEEEPVVTYTVPATECVLASDLGISRNTTSQNIDMYVDGNGNLYKYAIQPADVVTTLGGQGTTLEVYKNSKRLVIIHTWLAQVTSVTPVVRDAAGHIISKASISVNVYDQANGTTFTTKSWTSNSNFEYAAGDYVLVNDSRANNQINGSVVEHVAANGYLTILGKAPAKVGAQTYIWYNADKHTINGVDYNDAEWYRLDKAGNQTQEFNWLFDQYGNVIGSVELPAAAPRFAIIDNIQWINPIGSAGYAQATLRYIDNTTEVKTVAGIDANMDGDIADANEALIYAGVNAAVTLGSGIVSDNIAENTAYVATDLYQVITNPNGTVTLVHVNDGAVSPTKNESTAAKIYNSSYAIANAGTTQYVNEDTVFMVKKGNSFELVTGYKNISTYTNGGAGITIDWLQLDTDPYLEFVFVNATADNQNGTALFFRTSDSYRHHITAQGVLCEVTGLVDGVEKTLVERTCLCTTTKFAPYALTLTNGAVTAATPLSSGNSYGTYTLTQLAASDVKTWNGVVLNDVTTGTYYNVLGLYEAPTYGTWAANLTGTEIWVLWKLDATTGDNVAAAVYVIPNNANTTPGAGAGTPGVVSYGYDLAVAADATTFDVTYMKNGVAENVSSNVFFSYVAYVNGVETTTATNCLLASGNSTVQIATGLAATSGDVVTIIITVGTETITESVTIA